MVASGGALTRIAPGSYRTGAFNGTCEQRAVPPTRRASRRGRVATSAWIARGAPTRCTSTSRRFRRRSTGSARGSPDEESEPLAAELTLSRREAVRRRHGTARRPGAGRVPPLRRARRVVDGVVPRAAAGSGESLFHHRVRLSVPAGVSDGARFRSADLAARRSPRVSKSAWRFADAMTRKHVDLVGVLYMLWGGMSLLAQRVAALHRASPPRPSARGGAGWPGADLRRRHRGGGLLHARRRRPPLRRPCTSGSARGCGASASGRAPSPSCSRSSTSSSCRSAPPSASTRSGRCCTGEPSRCSPRAAATGSRLIVLG